MAFVAAFVQSIKYEVPPETYESVEHGEVNTIGIFMPLEHARPAYSFLVGKQGHEHLFVGIRGVPRKGDRFITLNGVKYVLLELTAPLGLGKIPENEWDAYKRGKLKPLKVVGD